MQDGRAVRVRGNQNSKTNHGYVYPRGHLIPQQLYDPDCIKVPMKRSSPVKGHGVDPKWVPISWDEALDTAAEKMFELRRGNETHKLVYMRGRYSSTPTDLRYGKTTQSVRHAELQWARLRPSIQAPYSSPAAMIVSQRVV